MGVIYFVYNKGCFMVIKCQAHQDVEARRMRA